MEMARQRRLQAEESLGTSFHSFRVHEPEKESSLPVLSDEIPAAMRTAILRLVETQREEQEEEEREERERVGARVGGVLPRHRQDEDEEEDERAPRNVGNDGEQSGDEGEGDGQEPATAGVPIDLESILEQAYISDKKVFERDAGTRRGKSRAGLRDQTGSFSHFPSPSFVLWIRTAYSYHLSFLLNFNLKVCRMNN